MTVELPDWTRPNYQPGGGEPFLLYVIYGDFAPLPPLSRKTYRTDGVPVGLTLEHYHRSRNPETLDGFLEGYLWQEFQRYDEPVARQVQAAGQCIVLRGRPKDDRTLNYLRDAVGMLMFLLDNGGSAVYDPQMFRWWDPVDWKRALILPDAPVPRHHVAIMTSEEPSDNPDQPGRTWFHSRGMRKFGRPDLSVHNVAAEMDQPVIELCNHIIEFEALGGVIGDGRTFDSPNLPRAFCRVGGSVEDVDFNNTHVEITFGNKALGDSV